MSRPGVNLAPDGHADGAHAAAALDETRKRRPD